MSFQYAKTNYNSLLWSRASQTEGRDPVRGRVTIFSASHRATPLYIVYRIFNRIKCNRIFYHWMGLRSKKSWRPWWNTAYKILMIKGYQNLKKVNYLIYLDPQNPCFRSSSSSSFRGLSGQVWDTTFWNSLRNITDKHKTMSKTIFLFLHYFCNFKTRYSRTKPHRPKLKRKLTRCSETSYTSYILYFLVYFLSRNCKTYMDCLWCHR